MKKIQKAVVLCLAAVLIFSTAGCETLRKKFIRKRKTAASQEVMVVSPRDYSAHPFPNDVMYRQYFTYWKAWNQELITALNDRASNKKVLGCVDQALVNLKKMSTYLIPEKADVLAVQIQKTQTLETRIRAVPGLPAAEVNRFRYTADRILSVVNREFDPTRMKLFLLPDATAGGNMPDEISAAPASDASLSGLPGGYENP